MFLVKPFPGNPINKFSHLDKPVGELVSFFQQKPGAWWANKENQLSFLNWFREALGYESLERFYSTPRELLTRMGGTQLLKVHNSLGAAVTDNYPTHYWEKWRFVDRDSNWHHEQNQRRAYFDSVGKTLRFSGLEDWYKYPMDSLKTVRCFVKLYFTPSTTLIFQSFRKCLKN